MGQMYPRKPFSGLVSSLNPDAVLRDVRPPTVPPPAHEMHPLRAAVETEHADADADTATIREELSTFAARFGTALKEHPLGTIGASVAVGIAFGALFGSRIGRIAVLIAGGVLLHNLLPSSHASHLEDTARRAGA